MLIVYPATSWNSFSSLADANTIVLEEIPYAQRKDNWDSITDIAGDLTADQQKEVLLKQATRDIKLRLGDNLPSTLEYDLQLATVLLANHSVNIDMSNEDGSSNIKIEEVTGAVKTEYFKPSEDKSNDLPDNVEQLLQQYDLKSSGSFPFKRA